MVIALVDIGCVGQTCRQEEANHKANEQSKAEAQPVKADIVNSGIAEQKIRDQGGDTGGIEHSVGHSAQLLLLHSGIQENAQNGGDRIQKIDAPRAKADGEDHTQSGDLIGLCAGQADEQRAEQTHQAHIQEGGGVAAKGKVVSGDLTGLGHNLPQAGKHTASVRQDRSGDQKADADEGKEQTQKIAFRQIVDSLHILSLFLKKARTGIPSVPF